MLKKYKLAISICYLMLVMISQINCGSKPHQTRTPTYWFINNTVSTTITVNPTNEVTSLVTQEPQLYINTPSLTSTEGTRHQTIVDTRVLIIPLDVWQLPSNIKELLDEINSLVKYPYSYLDVENIECGNHPDRVMLGHIIPLVEISKQNLKDLNLGNYYYQYDCTLRQYRVVIAGKQPNPICTCPP